MDRSFPRVIGDIVEVTFRIRMFQVDRRRDDPIDDTENGNRGLDSSSCAEGMPQHRFGRTDSQVIRMVAKTGLDSLCLSGIIEASSGSMRVDIIRPVKLQTLKRSSQAAGF